MGKRILIVVVSAVAVVFILLSPKPKDQGPVYKGKTLAEWVALDEKSELAPEEEEKKVQYQQCTEAIRAIGTNGLPFLLKRIQYEPPRIFYKVQKLPEFISGGRVADALILDPVERSWREAGSVVTAFAMLGAEAVPAVPELTRLMCDTNRPSVSSRATWCLAAMGKEGLPSLLIALTNNTYLPRFAAAVSAMAHFGTNFGTNAAIAVPILATNVTNSNFYIAESAVRALGQIRLEPQIAVPALVNALQTTNRVLLRFRAAHALGEFGTNALSAVPLLIRMDATNALSKIAPAALTEWKNKQRPL